MESKEEKPKIEEIGEEGMEIERAEENDIYDSDADTFNNSTNVPVNLEYIERQYIHHSHSVLTLAVNRQNKAEFATGGMDDQLVVWDIDDCGPTQGIKYKESVNNIAFSFDGKYLAASVMNNKIHVLQKNDDTYEPKHEFELFEEEINVSLKVLGFPSKRECVIGRQ